MTSLFELHFTYSAPRPQDIHLLLTMRVNMSAGADYQEEQSQYGGGQESRASTPVKEAEARQSTPTKRTGVESSIWKEIATFFDTSEPCQ